MLDCMPATSHRSFKSNVWPFDGKLNYRQVKDNVLD